MNHWLLRLAIAVPFISSGLSALSYMYGFDLPTLLHVLGLAAGVMVLVGGFKDYKIGDMCITFIGAGIIALLTAAALLMSHVGIIAAIPILGVSLYMAMEYK